MFSTTFFRWDECLSTARLAKAIVVGLLASAVPAPAAAWSNGVDGPNAFGTHDWILKKAIRAAGADASVPATRATS